MNDIIFIRMFLDNILSVGSSPSVSLYLQTFNKTKYSIFFVTWKQGDNSINNPVINTHDKTVQVTHFCFSHIGYNIKGI